MNDNADYENHDPRKCNFRECKSLIDTPCPFVADVKQMRKERDEQSAVETCKHEWRQLIGDSNNPTNAFYCTFCLARSST